MKTARKILEKHISPNYLKEQEWIVQPIINAMKEYAKQAINKCEELAPTNSKSGDALEAVFINVKSELK